MMAMTTNSSTRVNPLRRDEEKGMDQRLRQANDEDDENERLSLTITCFGRQSNQFFWLIPRQGPNADLCRAILSGQCEKTQPDRLGNRFLTLDRNFGGKKVSAEN
jgi:hypothetical protein